MNTIILYTSKYGTTEKIAREIANRIASENNVTLISISHDSPPDLAIFDKVIIGTPIYAGKSYGKIKRFCQEKRRELNGKTIGLFVCGLEEKEDDRLIELTNAFPNYLHDIAIAKCFINGKVDYKKLTFFEKLIMKLMKKDKTPLSTIDYDAINLFAEKIK